MHMQNYRNRRDQQLPCSLFNKDNEVCAVFLKASPNRHAFKTFKNMGGSLMVTMCSHIQLHEFHVFCSSHIFNPPSHAQSNRREQNSDKNCFKYVLQCREHLRKPLASVPRLGAIQMQILEPIPVIIFASKNQHAQDVRRPDRAVLEARRGQRAAGSELFPGVCLRHRNSQNLNPLAKFQTCDSERQLSSLCQFREKKHPKGSKRFSTYRCCTSFGRKSWFGKKCGKLHRLQLGGQCFHQVKTSNLFVCISNFMNFTIFALRTSSTHLRAHNEIEQNEKNIKIA